MPNLVWSLVLVQECSISWWSNSGGLWPIISRISISVWCLIVLVEGFILVNGSIE